MTDPDVPQQDIRWKQRFQNFDRMVILLREPFERDVATLSNLEKEGTVHLWLLERSIP